MMSTNPEILDSTTPTAPLRSQVQSALQDYFRQLDGHIPGNLYKLVLQEMEHPLLETVMDYTRGNQSKAAEILGINRSTLRKKAETVRYSVSTIYRSDYAARHLMEQPMLGICSAGPQPVRATCSMASNRSRRTSSGAACLRLESNRPRYCSSCLAL